MHATRTRSSYAGGKVMPASIQRLRWSRCLPTMTAALKDYCSAAWPSFHVPAKRRHRHFLLQACKA